MAICSRERT